MTQFLKSTHNGHVYHANPMLLKRKDMVPCNAKGQTAYDQVGLPNPEEKLAAMTTPGVVDVVEPTPAAPEVPQEPSPPEPPQEPEAQQPAAEQKAARLLSEDEAKAKVLEWFGRDVSKVTVADLRKYAAETLNNPMPEEKMTKLALVTLMAKG